MYRFVCPYCSGWVKRLSSGRSDNSQRCLATVNDEEPILRVMFDDPRGNGRKSYKIAHADGSICCPTVYSPTKPVPCTMCDARKGERHDPSGGGKDPAKAMCRKCFTNFRVTFARSAFWQAAAQSTSSGSTSDYYSLP